MNVAVEIFECLAAMTNDRSRECCQSFRRNFDRPGNEKFIVRRHRRIAEPSGRGGGLGAWQMRNAILFAIARNAELELRIGQFCGAAGGTAMQRFGRASRFTLEALPSHRDFLAMPCRVIKLRAEKDEVIRKCRDKSRAVGIRSDKESDQEKKSRDPGDPFYFRWQDKQNVDHLIGIKTGVCEEERGDKHGIGKIAAEEKRRQRCPNHSDKEVERDPKSSPGLFEAFANKPEKPKRENKPKRAERPRQKNVSNQSPDFAVTNAFRIEVEQKTDPGIQRDQDKNKGGKPDNDAKQSRNTEEPETAFQFIEPDHVRGTLANAWPCSILRLSEASRSCEGRTGI
jgi:hypothetical protein